MSERGRTLPITCKPSRPSTIAGTKPSPTAPTNRRGVPEPSSRREGVEHPRQSLRSCVVADRVAGPPRGSATSPSGRRISGEPDGPGGRQSRGEWALSCDDTRSGYRCGHDPGDDHDGSRASLDQRKRAVPASALLSVHYRGMGVRRLPRVPIVSRSALIAFAMRWLCSGVRGCGVPEVGPGSLTSGDRRSDMIPACRCGCSIGSSGRCSDLS
jgi:hypothetical protein